MIIVKHKSVKMTPEEIMQAAVEHNPPAGTVCSGWSAKNTKRYTTGMK